LTIWRSEKSCVSEIYHSLIAQFCKMARTKRFYRHIAQQSADNASQALAGVNEGVEQREEQSRDPQSASPSDSTDGETPQDDAPTATSGAADTAIDSSQLAEQPASPAEAPNNLGSDNVQGSSQQALAERTPEQSPPTSKARVPNFFAKLPKYDSGGR
jgi:hypothetical protein